MEKSVADVFEALADRLELADIYEADVVADIATAILQKRIDLGMTQTQFGKKLGVRQSMVSKWENGEYNFTIRSIAQICAKLNLTFSIDLEDYAETHAKWTFKSAKTSPAVQVDYSSRRELNASEYKNKNPAAMAA